MSDDLVKRARHNALSDMPHYASVELIEALADRIEELEAEKARLREAQAWQSIETASQIDEHRILVSDGKLVMIAEWVAGKHVEGGVGYWAEVLGDSCEYTRFSMKLTHWMPLPELPKRQTNE